MQLLPQQLPNRSNRADGTGTRVRAGLTLLAAALLAGCGSLDGVMSSDSIDYRRTQRRDNALEVPPDLTQLARETRYQIPQGQTVTASGMRPNTGSAAPGVAATAPTVPAAATTVGSVQLMREGQTRWLHTTQPPEVVAPKVRAFWTEIGLPLTTDDAAVGVFETQWAENRARVPKDFIRNTIGRIAEGLYSTGEMDRYRTRLERASDGGTDIYVTHRGMVETIVGPRDERTLWQPRPAEPLLEAEMLSRMLIKLGGGDDARREATLKAAGPQPGEPATRIPGMAASPLPDRANLVVAEPFDRAWRTVGLALDRSGFTVEDRDRSAGLYFMRYVDPRKIEAGEGNFFSRLFSKDDPASALRYRVLVRAAGANTEVSVQNANGEADQSENARRIIGTLADRMR